MAQKWADRIAAGLQTDKTALHNARWKVWDHFIGYYCETRHLDSEKIPRDDTVFTGPGAPSAILTYTCSGCWSKIECRRDGNLETIFDASFGSMDNTSDLDVTVLSTDSEVLEMWIHFLVLELKEKKT